MEEAGHDEHREDGKPHNGLVNGLVSSVLGNARSKRRFIAGKVIELNDGFARPWMTTGGH
jgi:hypothetical protein